LHKRWVRCIRAERGPKVSLWPDGSTSPRNYGWLLVYIHGFTSALGGGERSTSCSGRLIRG
jgi:hypothetical protein